jgi:hypothetical protein
LTGSGSLLSLRMKAIEPQHRRPSATTRCCLSYRILSSRTAVIAIAFPAALWVSLDGLHCCLTPASGPPCPYSCVRGVVTPKRGNSRSSHYSFQRNAAGSPAALSPGVALSFKNRCTSVFQGHSAIAPCSGQRASGRTSFATHRFWATSSSYHDA